MATKYKLTPEHEARLPAWRDKWIANAMSTKPMDDTDRASMREAVLGLYAAANLPPPKHIVFVPSPFVLHFAGGFAAAIWHLSRQSAAATAAATYAATAAATAAATRDATYDATRAATADATAAATYAATAAATYAATYAATADATADATYDATYDATRAATADATAAATRAATYAATRAATYAATADATRWYSCDTAAIAHIAVALGGEKAEFLLSCSTSSWRMRDGGNQWSSWASYVSFFRHVAKLPVDYSKWRHYEAAAVHGGPRFMHADFCMISDRPEVLKVDQQNRPHCEDGPFCRWRDGSTLYAWHGVYVPRLWVEDRANLTAAMVMAEQNLERRRAGIEMIGWAKILRELNAVEIDADPDPMVGTLVAVDLPISGAAPIRAQFLRVLCGTGREFAIGVDPAANCRTALDAQAWFRAMDPKDFAIPQVRT